MHASIFKRIRWGLALGLLALVAAAIGSPGQGAQAAVPTTGDDESACDIAGQTATVAAANALQRNKWRRLNTRGATWCTARRCWSPRTPCAVAVDVDTSIAAGCLDGGA